MTTEYPENTLALATVRGVPNVLVLRRKTYVRGVQSTSEGSEPVWNMDWAHTHTEGFTCSGDDDVTDVEVLHDLMAALP